MADTVFKSAEIMKSLKGKGKIITHMNTSSTVHMDQTVSDPNFTEIVFCISSILHAQMLEDQDKDDGRSTELFSKYPEFHIKSASEGTEARSESVSDAVEKPEEEEKVPSNDIVFGFLSAVQHAIKNSVESSIIALMYINRVTSMSEMSVTTKSWKGLWVGAISLAMKVWDSKSNASAMLEACPLNISKKLVRLVTQKVFHLLNRVTGVKPSDYTLYYFELRELFTRIVGSDRISNWKEKPLSILKERQMEERSERRESVKLVCTDIFSARYTKSFRTEGSKEKKDPKTTNLTYEDVTRSDTTRFVIS